MGIISEVKCSRCDRKYSGVRSRCPYCGARRIGRGKFSDDTDNTRGRMLIGVLIMSVLVVAAGVLLFTTPPPESPGGALADSPPPVSDSSVLGEDDNTSYAGLNSVEPADTPDVVSETPTLAPVKAEKIEIWYGSTGMWFLEEFTASVGEATPVSAKFEPLNAEGVIMWESSDETVFQVVPTSDDKRTANVTGLKKGTAILTVTIGEISAECIVRIKN